MYDRTPPHQDVKELQDCIKFLLFPDAGRGVMLGKPLDNRSGWFTFAKSIVEALGQGHERPTAEHFQEVADAIFHDIDLDRDRRARIEADERAMLARLQEKYPDAR